MSERLFLKTPLENSTTVLKIILKILSLAWKMHCIEETQFCSEHQCTSKKQHHLETQFIAPSINTSLCLYCAKTKTVYNQTQKLIWDEEEKCPVIWQVKNSRSFLNDGRPILQAKEEMTHLGCYLSKKPASVMVCGCVAAHGWGNLHVWKCSINAEWHIQVLEQLMLPRRELLFERESDKTMLSHILHIFQQHGCIV